MFGKYEIKGNPIRLDIEGTLTDVDTLYFKDINLKSWNLKVFVKQTIKNEGLKNISIMTAFSGDKVREQLEASKENKLPKDDNEARKVLEAEKIQDLMTREEVEDVIFSTSNILEDFIKKLGSTNILADEEKKVPVPSSFLKKMEMKDIEGLIIEYFLALKPTASGGFAEMTS